VDPEYGRRYRELHRRHWWWRARERVILKTLERLTPAEGFGRILDVGCGDGLLFPHLSRLGAVEGIEPDADIVTRAETAHGRIHVRPFDATFRPEARYGLILMLDVLEHLDDPDAAARQVRDLLEPNGLLLVTVPALGWLWTAHDVLNEHRTRYERGALVRLLQAAGLGVEQARYHFRWMVPAKLVLRAKERVLGGEPRVPRVPPVLLNRLLYGVSRAEDAVLGWSVTLPGSSLLAVARRAEA